MKIEVHNTDGSTTISFEPENAAEIYQSEAIRRDLLESSADWGTWRTEDFHTGFTVKLKKEAEK